MVWLRYDYGAPTVRWRYIFIWYGFGMVTVWFGYGHLYAVGTGMGRLRRGDNTVSGSLRQGRATVRGASCADGVLHRVSFFPIPRRGVWALGVALSRVLIG